MIIFYNNKTGKIYGTVNGRVHTEEELKTSVQPQGVDQKDISKKIFDLKETKKIEKQGFRVIQQKVKLKDGGFGGFAKADKVETAKPDAVDTILIDLTRSLEEIEADFSQTTRRWIRQAEAMTFREIGTKESSIIFDVLEELEDMKDIRLAKHLLRVRAPFLDGLRRMYVVEDVDKKPLSVALITSLTSKGFVYSLGGVTQAGRDTHAGDFLIWELIQDAKQLGFKIFDLGGIYADWASDEKKKVNKFKQRWGGTIAPIQTTKRG